VFAFSSLAALISYSSAAGAVFLLSLYLQYVTGLSPERTGIILLAAPLVQTLVSPLAGRLSDRIEPRLVASIGMALTALALAGYTALGAGTRIEVVVACLAVFGLGFAFFSSPNTNAIMGSVNKRMYGVASGIVGTMRLTGQMLSMGIVMLVLSTHMGQAHITRDTIPLFLRSARIAFTLFAALCTAGIFASLARGRVR
jgi:MFS family permease